MLASMRKFLQCGKPAVALAALLGVLAPFAAAATASTLSAQAQRLDAGWLQARGLALSLHASEGAASGALELRIERLDADALGYHLRRLHWRCPLERSATGWLCEGAVAAQGLKNGRLRIAIDDGGPRLELARKSARLGLRRSDPAEASKAGWRIDATALPVDWLQPLLTQVWPQATLTGGALQAELQLAAGEGGRQQLAGTLELASLGVDTDDGRIAAADLGGDGRLALDWDDDRLTVDTALSLRGGELLIGALYAALPASVVEFALRATRAPSRWQVDALRWHDPGVLMLDGSAELRADQGLHALQLAAELPDLAVAHARYLDGWLGSLGGSGLQPRGALALQVAKNADDWQLGARLRELSIDDARGRFALDDANGELRWHTGSAPRPGDLRWRRAAVHGIELGASELALDSRDGWLRLAAPGAIPALGGRLDVAQFGWRPPLGGASSPQLELAVELVDLDLAQLSARFGWPAFRGRLAGSVPAARYQAGVLQFEGGLGIDVFDGRVDVAALRMERPFGIAPRLEADIAIRLLDLQALTAVLGFGEISGRLDGRIDGLQLVDWQPVAFDAQLRTSTSAKDKRRISRRAVADLTSIGGGGLAGGLQASALRMFDEFSYRQIGLRCRLANEVCEMGGLDSLPSGYTIVEGAGLPRISVIGHQRRVDWPVLVERLKAVSAGQALRID